MMVTIPDTDPKWAETILSNILYAYRKDDLIKMSKKLDLWVSPNVSKDKVVLRLANQILEEPASVYSCISKTEFPLLVELIEAEKGVYVERKIRKMAYMVQKMGFVITYVDEANDLWKMIMPSDLRETLFPLLPDYKALHAQGLAFPTPREIRLHCALLDFFGK